MHDLASKVPQDFDNNTAPIEVEILTKDYEIQGLVHVSREVRERRRLSELLNDTRRRFIAVTDARLIARNGPATPRYYSFVQLHVDTILMIHPSMESMAREVTYGEDEQNRFEELRGKMNQPRPGVNAPGEEDPA
ncbi:MAG: hypothetical protein AB7P76_07570 [Candidatus Melainabacteria bacterium]